MHFEKLRAALRRRIRYGVTRGGLLFALAVALVGAAAAISANNLLFLILAAMLATLLISGFISRLCLAGLELDLLLPEHISARRETPGKLYVRNLKHWIASFSIHIMGYSDDAVKHAPGWTRRSPVGAILSSSVYFPVIPGGAVLEENVEVRFARRGAYRSNSFALTTRFPFGFLEKSTLVTLSREVVVYPSLEPQPRFEELLAGIGGEIESHFQGLGKDFYRIRPYEAFESARHLDWKASAHVGDLQVREYAREQERTVEIFLDRDVPAGLEEWFERAVECCAFLVWRLTQQGAGVRFRSQQYAVRLPEQADVYTILKYLALVYPQQERQLESPADETSFQIVLSAAPHRFTDAGWNPARAVGPDFFSASVSSPASAAGPAAERAKA